MENILLPKKKSHEDSQDFRFMYNVDDIESYLETQNYEEEETDLHDDVVANAMTYEDSVKEFWKELEEHEEEEEDSSHSIFSMVDTKASVYFSTEPVFQLYHYLSPLVSHMILYNINHLLPPYMQLFSEDGKYTGFGYFMKGKLQKIQLRVQKVMVDVNNVMRYYDKEDMKSLRTNAGKLVIMISLDILEGCFSNPLINTSPWGMVYTMSFNIIRTQFLDTYLGLTDEIEVHATPPLLKQWYDLYISENIHVQRFFMRLEILQDRYLPFTLVTQERAFYLVSCIVSFLAFEFFIMGLETVCSVFDVFSDFLPIPSARNYAWNLMAQWYPMKSHRAWNSAYFTELLKKNRTLDPTTHLKLTRFYDLYGGSMEYPEFQKKLEEFVKTDELSVPSQVQRPFTFDVESSFYTLWKQQFLYVFYQEVILKDMHEDVGGVFRFCFELSQNHVLNSILVSQNFPNVLMFMHDPKILVHIPSLVHESIQDAKTIGDIVPLLLSRMQYLLRFPAKSTNISAREFKDQYMVHTKPYMDLYFGLNPSDTVTESLQQQILSTIQSSSPPKWKDMEALYQLKQTVHQSNVIDLLDSIERYHQQFSASTPLNATLTPDPNQQTWTPERFARLKLSLLYKDSTFMNPSFSEEEMMVRYDQSVYDLSIYKNAAVYLRPIRGEAWYNDQQRFFGLLEERRRHIEGFQFFSKDDREFFRQHVLPTLDKTVEIDSMKVVYKDGMLYSPEKGYFWKENDQWVFQSDRVKDEVAVDKYSMNHGLYTGILFQGKPFGEGSVESMSFGQGMTYSGTVMNGTPFGDGSGKGIPFQNGSYEGELRDGKPWGKGFVTDMTLEDGAIYTGVLWNGEMVHSPEYSGNVFNKSYEGGVYSGPWNENKPQGYGTVTNMLLEGGRYSGSVKNGLPSGKGIFTLRRGTQYVSFPVEYQEGRVISGYKQNFPWKEGTYSGLVRDNLPMGEGYFTNVGFQDGIYTGPSKDGVPSGEGVVQHMSFHGGQYSGFVKDGEPSGEGSIENMSFAKGLYRGPTKDGLPFGKGTVDTIAWGETGTYSGEVVDGKPSGKGTVHNISFHHGKYSGEVVDGEPTGKGYYEKIVTRKGTYTGAYENGEPSGEGSIQNMTFQGGVYQGSVFNGEVSGNGKVLGMDFEGGKYDGSLMDGIPHGQGHATKIQYKNGLYTGLLMDQKPYGTGNVFNMYFQKGTFTGSVKDGVPWDGNGVDVAYPSGGTYTGSFQNGKPTGNGSVVEMSYEGGRYTGFLRDGKPIGMGTVSQFQLEGGGVYHGPVKDGKPTGEGSVENMVLEKGRYTGKVREGHHPVGEGKVEHMMILAGGEEARYSGMLLDGVPHGKGGSLTMFGSTTVTEYDKGNVITGFVDEASYKGFVKDGKRHGSGTWHTPEKVYEGVFEEGRFVNGKLETKDCIYEGNYTDQETLQGKGRISYKGQGEGIVLSSDMFENGFVKDKGKIIVNGVVTYEGVLEGNRIPEAQREANRATLEKKYADKMAVAKNSSFVNIIQLQYIPYRINPEWYETNLNHGDEKYDRNGKKISFHSMNYARLSNKMLQAMMEKTEEKMLQSVQEAVKEYEQLEYRITQDIVTMEELLNIEWKPIDNIKRDPLEADVRTIANGLQGATNMITSLTGIGSSSTHTTIVTDSLGKAVEVNTFAYLSKYSFDNQYMKKYMYDKSRIENNSSFTFASLFENRKNISNLKSFYHHKSLINSITNEHSSMNFIAIWSNIRLYFMSSQHIRSIILFGSEDNRKQNEQSSFFLSNFSFFKMLVDLFVADK